MRKKSAKQNELRAAIDEIVADIERFIIKHMVNENITIKINLQNQVHNLIFAGQYDFDKIFNSTFACVYAIVQVTNYGRKIIYVGQTDNINQRFSNHQKKDCWRKHVKSNALYVYKEDNQNNRLLIESLIIQQYNPPCNG